MTRVNDALRYATTALAGAVVRARAEKQAFAKSKKLLRGFLAMLDSQLSESDAMWVSMWGSSPRVTVALHDLDGFKSPRLTRVLDLLETVGDSESSTDWPAQYNRDFEYRVGEIKVRVSAYVMTDSPTCRRIQVGVRSDEVPVYELKCD